jgi:hypothetical protein
LDRYAIIQLMRLRARGRRVLGFVILCAVVALGGARPRAAHQVPVTLTAPIAPPASGFRLGTAARPFGWSTAIGDLNADGRPDFAVADRVGRRPSGFAYAIELVMTGGRSQSVAFDSDQDALSVTLRDVDRDRDLDLVVTGTLSRSVVGVWLNDGTGHFERAAPQPVTASWQPSSGTLTGDPRDDVAAGESTTRAGTESLAADRVCGDVRLPISTLASWGAFRTARATLAALRPRAPPPASRIAV